MSHNTNQLADDQLVDEISRTLRDLRDYRVSVPAHDTDEIARVRSCGRRAGRALGRRVRTLVSDHPPSEGAVAILVVLADTTEEESELLMRRLDAAEQGQEAGQKAGRLLAWAGKGRRLSGDYRGALAAACWEGAMTMMRNGFDPEVDATSAQAFQEAFTEALYATERRELSD